MREFGKPLSVKNQVVPQAAEGAKLGLLLRCGHGTDPVVSKAAKTTCRYFPELDLHNASLFSTLVWILCYNTIIYILFTIILSGII